MPEIKGPISRLAKTVTHEVGTDASTRIMAESEKIGEDVPSEEVAHIFF